MSDPWLILETSGRVGQVGLIDRGRVVDSGSLDPGRRHNRDLAPAVKRMLARAACHPSELQGIMVSIGPGSFTGLRVGVMSAKSLTYALGCKLVVVPTFLSIAWESPAEALIVDVIADALKGLVYTQRFHRMNDTQWHPASELRIEPVGEWTNRLTAECWVSGPGLDVHEARVPIANRRVRTVSRNPSVAAVYEVGKGMEPLGFEPMLKLEPLYLRASSAEEKGTKSITRSA